MLPLKSCKTWVHMYVAPEWIIMHMRISHDKETCDNMIIQIGKIRGLITDTLTLHLASKDSYTAKIYLTSIENFKY